MTRTKWLLLIAGLFIIAGIALVARGQSTAAPPSKYQPTELQSLKLSNLQKDAIIAQQQMNALQQQLQTVQATFQSKLKDYTDEAERVKVAQKWDAKVMFDPNSGTFSDPPPAQAPAQAPSSPSAPSGPAKDASKP